MTRDRSGRCCWPNSGRSARTARSRSAAGWWAAGRPPARSRQSRSRGSSCRCNPATRSWRCSPRRVRRARIRAARGRRCSPGPRTRSHPRRCCGTSARTCTARSRSGPTAPARAAPGGIAMCPYREPPLPCAIGMGLSLINFCTSHQTGLSEGMPGGSRPSRAGRPGQDPCAALRQEDPRRGAAPFVRLVSVTDKDPLILDLVNDRVLDGADLDEYYVGDLDYEPANWDDIDLEDMFDLPPVLPPVRLPEEAELAVQAGRSALLADLRALADEVRTTTVHADAVNPVLLRLAE